MGESEVKSITLSCGQATVRPPTVATVRMILPLFEKLEDMTLLEFLIQHFDDIAQAAGDCLKLPDGKVVDDLTVEDLFLFWRALKEVSPDFFAVAAKVGGLGQLQSPFVSLIDPASSLSNGDMTE
jgi:hypothetical protein